MNHDETKPPAGSPDAVLEARIVAWVTGEASPFEMAELEKLIHTRPELAIFKRRIEAVHGLLGEATRLEREPLRLSSDRRAKLLQAMGVPADANTDANTVQPTVLATKSAQRNRRWIYAVGTAAAACAIFGLTIATLTQPMDKRVARNNRNVSVALTIAQQESTPAEQAAQAAAQAKREEMEVRLKMPIAASREDQPAPGLLVQEPGIVTTNSLAYVRGPNATLDGAGGAGGRVAESPPPSTTPPWDQQPPVKMDALVVTAPGDVGFVGGGALAGGRLLSEKPSASISLGASQANPAAGIATALDDALRQGGVGNKAQSQEPLRTEDRRVARADQSFRGFGTSTADTYRFTAPANKPAEETVNLDPFSVSPTSPNRGFGFSGGLVGTQIVSTEAEKQKAYTVTTNEYNAPTRGFFSGLFGRDNAADEKKVAANANAAPAGMTETIKLDPFSVARDRDAGFVAASSMAGGRITTALKDTPVPYSAQTPDFLRQFNIQTLAKENGATAVVNGKTETFVPTENFAGSIANQDRARPVEPRVATLDAERAGQQSQEISTAQEATSTFSLHVSDVSFRLAQAAFARGEAPDASRIRPEEFYNAFDYGDPTPAASDKIGCKIEQSVHPVLQQRNLLRIAMKVPSTGRGSGTPLRLTVLLDTSGSMEREDRASSVQRAFEVLVSLLGPNDRITLIGFARQPRLMAENLAGNEARSLLALLARTPADGGTNLEEALGLASQLAQRHQTAGAQNRVVLLTDGAANLGNANPTALAERVTALRQRGIAFDACGVGLNGINDDVLEALTRQGDGRYYVLNSPEAADSGFARQLAGAFRPAAENVKVQVRFNPARVARQRLVGFEQHRLATEDFRNDAVDAAELAADEAANALYQIEVLPQGTGEVGEVFVRFRDPASGQMVERSWTIAYEAGAAAFDRATPSLQLAGTAALLAEKLRHSTLGEQIKLGDFARIVDNVRQHYAAQPRVQEFVTMFGQARRMFSE